MKAFTQEVVPRACSRSRNRSRRCVTGACDGARGGQGVSHRASRKGRSAIKDVERRGEVAPELGWSRGGWDDSEQD